MFLTLVLTTFSSVLLAIYFWFKINFNYWARHPQIPSVGHIFSGSLKEFLTFKTNYGFHLRKIYEDEKFQNEAVVGIYGLYRPALLIREPELIKSVFIKEFNSFRNRSCEGGRHDLLGSLNLFFARYPQWRENRLKLVPVFSSGKLKKLYHFMWQVGADLENFLHKQPDCFVNELQDLCGRYTTDVIAATLLGSTCHSLDNSKDLMFKQAVKLVEFNFKRAFDFLIILFAPKLHPLARPKVFNASTEQFLRSSIEQIIAERESTGIKRNDLIDAFIKMKKEAVAKGESVPYCMESIIAQTCILMTAAFDATSSAIYFTLLEMAKNPHIQQRLREDILQAFAKGKGDICYESLHKLEYLQMVISETLRMYPNLPMFERMHELHTKNSSAFNLKPYYDYELPNQMPVYISVFALHYDSKYWPNPKKFDPERFRPANKKLLPPMTYLPYGGGPHMCLGFRLGMLQAKVALVHFLKNHYVRVCNKTIPEPEFEPKAFVLQTKGGIYVEFVRDNLYSVEKNVNAT